MESTIIIRYKGSSSKELTENALQAKKRLEELVEDEIKIDLIKENNNTMDFGSTLAVIFGTPAIVMLAKGLYEMMKRHSDRIVIETSEGKIIASGEGVKQMRVEDVIENLKKI